MLTGQDTDLVSAAFGEVEVEDLRCVSCTLLTMNQQPAHDVFELETSVFVWWLYLTFLRKTADQPSSLCCVVCGSESHRVHFFDKPIQLKS